MTPAAVEDVPPIGRAEARLLAATENDRFLQLLHGLEPHDWSRPTDCTRWTVKDIAAHVVGGTEAFASPIEFLHQWRHASRARREIGAGFLIDGVNEVQVRDRGHCTPEQLMHRLAVAAPKAARVRADWLRPVRALPLPFPPPIGRRDLAYLVDRVLTRDVWMHRMDIAGAIGSEPQLTAGHDGRLVADMIAEWAGTHTEPFLLELTGPAGGVYRRGDARQTTRTDAVTCLRILSGRAPGHGALIHPLPL